MRFVAVLACIAAVGVLAGCSGKGQTVGPVTDGEIIDVGNGAAMMSEFRNNAIGAERKWIGKRVRLTALVTGIGKDSGGFYVGMSGPVWVYPSQAELINFEKCREFDIIVVEATITNWSNRSGDAPQLTAKDGKYIAFKERVLPGSGIKSPTKKKP